MKILSSIGYALSFLSLWIGWCYTSRWTEDTVAYSVISCLVAIAIAVICYMVFFGLPDIINDYKEKVRKLEIHIRELENKIEK